MNTHAGMWTQPDEWLVSHDTEPMAPPPLAHTAQRAGGTNGERPNGSDGGDAASPAARDGGTNGRAAARLVSLLDDAAAASRSPRPVASSPTSALDQLLAPKPSSPAADGSATPVSPASSTATPASPASSTAATSVWRSAVYKDDTLA